MPEITEITFSRNLRVGAKGLREVTDRWSPACGTEAEATPSGDIYIRFPDGHSLRVYPSCVLSVEYAPASAVEAAREAVRAAASVAPEASEASDKAIDALVPEASEAKRPLARKKPRARKKTASR